LIWSAFGKVLLTSGPGIATGGTISTRRADWGSNGGCGSSMGESSTGERDVGDDGAGANTESTGRL
jgi:hypothetical protein